MEQVNSARKDTGLRDGDAAKIARIHRVSVQHVVEVAKGNRPGRESLLKTIQKYRSQNTALVAV